MNHMTEVNTSSDQINFVHYLPHHGVVRENSRTTKLRIIFNGSSRTNDLLLNDILYLGAKLQTDICDILLWTRSRKVLFQRILLKCSGKSLYTQTTGICRESCGMDRTNSFSAYRFTVTYGLNCAAFLALRTLHQLVNDELPRIIVTLKRSFP